MVRIGNGQKFPIGGKFQKGDFRISTLEANDLLERVSVGEHEVPGRGGNRQEPSGWVELDAARPHCESLLIVVVVVVVAAVAAGVGHVLDGKESAGDVVPKLKSAIVASNHESILLGVGGNCRHLVTNSLDQEGAASVLGLNLGKESRLHPNDVRSGGSYCEVGGAELRLLGVLEAGARASSEGNRGDRSSIQVLEPGNDANGKVVESDCAISSSHDQVVVDC